MRHRLVVLTAVLAITGIAGCSRDKNARPDPQAQPAASTQLGASAHPGMSFTALPGPSGSVVTGASRPDTSTVDPAGASTGHPQTLPTGTDISAIGIGPYTIGQEQASLTAAKLVGTVKNGSTGCDTGAGQAKWGSPTLIFTKGKLEHLKITSGSVKTASGVKVGSTAANVHLAYPKGSARGTAAWYAPAGDFALLFRISGGKVSTIEAGPSSTLAVEGDTTNC